MAAWNRRALAAGALALLAVTAGLLPVLGNPNGNPIKDYTLCNATAACHGLVGSNTSRATVVLETPTLTVYAGEPNVSVTVRVSHAEQYSGDPMAVELYSTLYDPSIYAMLVSSGWVLQQCPNGVVPAVNYAQLPAQGVTGDTGGVFTWLLRAPAVPGDYPVVCRMSTGQDHLNRDGLTKPVSHDNASGLVFHVVPEPRLDSTAPVDGAVGVFANTPIVLAFNKPMDRPSVEAAFDVTPPTPGVWTWNGSVARYNLVGFFENRTRYTVTLGTSARDADGIHLLAPIAFSFTTGHGSDVYPPFVVSVIASRAPLDAVVRMAFSEAMDRGSTEAAFSMAPPVPGNLTWDGFTLVFTPSRLLEYDTLYTVTLAPTAKDLADNLMGMTVNATFRTIRDTFPPAVLSFAPANGSTERPLNSNVTLAFSDDVDRATLPGALATSPPVVWGIVWSGATATLVPQHQLDAGTNYTVTVGTALADVRGNHLVRALVFHFYTAGSADHTPPSLQSAYPVDGGRVSLDGSVQLTFSEPMNQSSVESAILVSPAANTTLRWDAAVLQLTFRGLEAGRVYTINLGPGARDVAGNPIDSPAVLRYVAAPTAPAQKPFYYVQDWIETWWDLALVVLVAALVGVVAVVQLRIGWRRVVLTAFAWVEERVRTARYLGQARTLYYSINRQMPQSHAERYGSKVLWYWYPFYCLGGIAILSFVVCGITGIILALYYVPSTAGNPSAAYASVEYIMHDVSFGYMFRALHHWSANVMIAAVFLHMLRVYFTGAYRNPRELNWIAGVVLLGLTLAYGFSGYLLPWNQLSYWAGTIGVEMARTVPLLGNWFANLVFGGLEMGAPTLTRMYTFHVFLLPIFVIGLILVHIVAVYIQGLAEPH